MDQFKKTFNSNTMNGRANVAKATYATFALLYVVHRLRKRSSNKPVKNCETCSACCEKEAEKEAAESAPYVDPGQEGGAGAKDGGCYVIVPEPKQKGSSEMEKYKYCRKIPKSSTDE